MSCCWKLSSLLIISLIAAPLSMNPARIHAGDSFRIVFGSCIQQDRPIPLLASMADTQPQLTILLGDNIYADTNDPEIMLQKYHTLGSSHDFQRLRDAAPMLAVWDDHDFGVNDGGSDYTMRETSQKLFLDFFGVPLTSPQRQQQGVYSAGMFGPAGRRIQVILLDARYHRTPLKTGPRRTGGPYYPQTTPGETMLGDTQWKWLEEQLRQPAQLRFIGCGIQMIADAAGQETWANMPAERARLFDLLRQTSATGVILLSGDRHWAELSIESELSDYPVYELTSSSLNQKHPRGTPTANTHRAIPKTYHEENFGQIDVSWDADDPVIRLQIIASDGSVPLSQQVRLSQLQSN